MLSVLIFVLAPPPVDTSILDECKDARGQKVAVEQDYRLPQPAVAKGNASGEPIIAYNPRSLLWIHEKTRQFIFAHECAHHQLAHLFGPITYAKEQAADCWAIQYLHNKGALDDSDLEDVQSDVGRITMGDDVHVTSGQRAANLKWCLTDSDSAVKTKPSSEYPGFCCTKSGRYGPYPNTSVAAGMECVGFDDKGKEHNGKACK